MLGRMEQIEGGTVPTSVLLYLAQAFQSPGRAGIVRGEEAGVFKVRFSLLVLSDLQEGLAQTELKFEVDRLAHDSLAEGYHGFIRLTQVH